MPFSRRYCGSHPEGTEKIGEFRISYVFDPEIFLISGSVVATFVTLLSLEMSNANYHCINEGEKVRKQMLSVDLQNTGV